MYYKQAMETFRKKVRKRIKQLTGLSEKKASLFLHYSFMLAGAGLLKYNSIMTKGIDKIGHYCNNTKLN